MEHRRNRINMKATGIVRRIDDLGRIVVPKEIRRTLRIREGDALEIFTDREGEIILKKYSPLGEMGNFADQYAESLAQTLGYLVCITDTDQVIAAAGPGKKEFQEQLITRQLAEVIARREQFLASSMDRKFTVIVSGQNAELMAGGKSDHLRRRCDRFCRDPGKGRQEKTR